MRDFFGSLRGRLSLIVLAALLPLLGFFAYGRFQLVSLGRAEVEQAALHLAVEAAGAHQEVLRETRALLSTLARFPELISESPEACIARLRELLEPRAYRTALGVIEPDGYTRCFVPQAEGPVYLGDRSYVREAFETGEPTLSAFQSGRVTGLPVLSAAHPVRDRGGVVRAVVAGGVQLSEVARATHRTDLPENSSLTLVDRRGVMLSRGPESGQWVGSPLPGPLADSVLGREEGVFAAEDLDGTPRIFGSRALSAGSDEPAAYVLVGFDRDVALATVNRLSTANAAAVALAALILTVGLWAFLDRAFVRRIQPVLDAARRLGNGDLDARAGDDVPGHDELAVLARSFDEMAERVQAMRREEARAARAEIQEQEVRLQQVASAVDQLFWLFDPQGDRILYVSPAYERLYGLPEEELREDPGSWIEAVHPDDREQVLEGGTARRRGRWAGEYRIVRPDGTVHWIEHRTYPIHDAEGRVYRLAGVAEDVTERRELEERMQQASKLEAIGRLAGGVAHDFNNVLTVMQGHVQLALAELDPDDPVRKDLEEVRRSGNRAADLTRQLLTFGRKQALRPRLVDPCEVIERLAELLHRLLSERVELEIRPRCDGATVHVDRTHLEQALINLTLNARDAMPDGGRVTIEAGPARIAEEPGDPDLERMVPGDYVVIAVEDEGAGIADAAREHVFEPFFTTKPLGEGTGLGLASVYGFVKQSGGYIWIRDAAASGTRFEIYLPRAREEDEEERGGREVEESGPAPAPGLGTP